MLLRIVNSILRVLGLLTLIGLGLSTSLHAVAQEPEALVKQSRVAFIGVADVVLYGQQGYCGSMKSYAGGTVGELIDGAKVVTMRLGTQLAPGSRCVGDFSFFAVPATAYVVRIAQPRSICTVELYRIVPGGDPVHENLTTEKQRLCLLPWNHE
jgi:hypothetical protein